jgi:hypothetical protein
MDLWTNLRSPRRKEDPAQPEMFSPDGRPASSLDGNAERVLTGFAVANHARSARNLRCRRLRWAERGIDTEGYSGFPRGIEHVEDRTR